MDSVATRLSAPATEDANLTLAQGVARGEPRAIGEAYERYGPAMLRVAAAVLSSVIEAEDAVQEVFVRLLLRRRAPMDLRAYLMQATRNECVSRIRRRRPEEPLSDTIVAPAKPCEASHLYAALARLPEEQREVVALKVYGELTFAEIGAATGVPLNTAASRYRYALEKLRGMLSGEDDA
jgi:RNA polymerase sigma-70 factor (ECF subfamily)